jgi:hypothetical protein
MNKIFADILDSALRAPSPHNTQPWLIKFLETEIEIYISEVRTLPYADKSNSDILRSIGACLENVRLALLKNGYKSFYSISSVLDFSKPIVKITWDENTDIHQKNDLYKMIPIRRTSRLPYQHTVIPADIITQLKEILLGSPINLHIADSEKEISQIRKLSNEATIFQFENKKISEELYKWLRFSKRDARWFRDGLNAECLTLNKVESFLSQYFLLPKILRFFVKTNLHKLVFSSPSKSLPFTNCLFLLTTKNDGIAEQIESGMYLQRLWLTAAKFGLVTHPISAAIDVEKTRKEIVKIFNLSVEEKCVNLFRIGYSKTCPRSHRLTASEIIYT